MLSSVPLHIVHNPALQATNLLLTHTSRRATGACASLLFRGLATSKVLRGPGFHRGIPSAQQAARWARARGGPSRTETHSSPRGEGGQRGLHLPRTWVPMGNSGRGPSCCLRSRAIFGGRAGLLTWQPEPCGSANSMGHTEAPVSSH